MYDGPIRILLVDDDKIDSMAVERHVKKMNLPYALTIAHSHAEALEYLTNKHFDVVLLDYRLGDGTGIDLLPHCGQTPAVFVTGSGSEEIAVEAMRQGAYDYITKDPDRNYLTVLDSTIQNVLERRRMEDERERLTREKDALIVELKEALASIKELRGLLPICSHCKKIRDDKGYWNQLESYLRAHHDVEFSHSICPECAETLYRDLDDGDSPAR